MDKIILSLNIMGLEKQELSICLFIVDLVRNDKYGELPGKNIRILFDITKDKLFEILEGLVIKNVFKYSSAHNNDTIYIKAGDGYYVFNKNYITWIPTSDSLFYKLCKQLKIRFTIESYNYILEHYSIMNEVEKSIIIEERLTPYELFDSFCVYYKKEFNKEYRTNNQARDLMHLKKVICECSYKNMKDIQIKEFIKWTFDIKANEFKGDFIVGFLPTCLKDYLMQNSISTTKFIKDENGNYRSKN